MQKSLAGRMVGYVALDGDVVVILHLLEDVSSSFYLQLRQRTASPKEVQ